MPLRLRKLGDPTVEPTKVRELVAARGCELLYPRPTWPIASEREVYDGKEHNNHSGNPLIKTITRWWLLLLGRVLLPDTGWPRGSRLLRGEEQGNTNNRD